MKLSIIIPVYNLETYIEETLNSLIQQTEREFEIIVVDDGSSDNTYIIAKEILEESKVEHYRIVKKENGGVSSARNRGLVEASGKYVMFLDGDDYISKELVANLYYEMSSGNHEVICWGFDKVKEDKKTIEGYFTRFKSIKKCLTGIEALENILVSNTMYICVGSAAYRKDLLLKYDFKYTEGCCNGEDQEFTYKLLTKAKQVNFINKVLIYYVRRNGSISNSYNIKKFDAIEAMNRTYEYINETDNSELKKIALFLKKKIIEHYLWNLHSCLSNSCKSINQIFNEIENKYPGLNEEMISIMKNYRGLDKKLMKVKIFQISPKVYSFLFSLKNKLSFS